MIGFGLCLMLGSTLVAVLVPTVGPWVDLGTHMAGFFFGAGLTATLLGIHQQKGE